jgi:hypothetical protein
MICGGDVRFCDLLSWFDHYFRSTITFDVPHLYPDGGAYERLYIGRMVF